MATMEMHEHHEHDDAETEASGDAATVMPGGGLSEGDRLVKPGKPRRVVVHHVGLAGARARQTHYGGETGQLTWTIMRLHQPDETLAADKATVARLVGVPVRDLRQLDLMIGAGGPEPADMMVRERAIVFNWEFIKAIITADAVLLLALDDARSPTRHKFAAELTSRLADRHAEGLATLQRRLNRADPAVVAGASQGGLVAPELPFELRALEACLDAACGQLESEAVALHADAEPALEALSRKVTVANSDALRRVKGRLTRLTARVDKLRALLLRFLDDDSDMRDMYLSRKKAAAAAAAAEAVAAPAGAPELRKSLSMVMKVMPLGAFDDSSIQEAESLLETYYVLLDSTGHTLEALAESVTDTEDLALITLDYHRNMLLQIDVVITSFGLPFTIINSLTGDFATMPLPGVFYNWMLMWNATLITSCCFVFGYFAAFFYLGNYYELFDDLNPFVNMKLRHNVAQVPPLSRPPPAAARPEARALEISSAI